MDKINYFTRLIQLSILTLSFIATLGHANVKSICGGVDDRELSYDPSVGRIYKDSKHYGCTATMISENCALTAGHCVEPALEMVEFNTVASREYQPVPSRLEDRYEVDMSSVQFSNEGRGDDWAVFKLKPNAITKKTAGSVQGFYDVDFFYEPIVGDRLVIVGYGIDADDPIRNFAQQSDEGSFSRYSRRANSSTLITHDVDTMGGNSGSTIRLTQNNKIIGIHTHGGCDNFYMRGNFGTLISTHKKLKAAIIQCLRADGVLFKPKPR